MFFEKSNGAALKSIKNFGEFDPGSERTLAAWIRHASRTRTLSVEASADTLLGKVAKG